MLFECSPREAIKFWGKPNTSMNFRILRRVAQQVFGNQASAAQIERDFGSAGVLLSGRRSRMNGFYVEMMRFLHLNFSRIPHVVPMLQKAAAESCLPKRFTGRDPELLRAHEYMDPLEDMTPIDLNVEIDIDYES